MTGLTQISKHVQKPAVHRTKSFRKEVFVDGLVPEVKVPGEPIIGNAVPLNASPNLLNMPQRVLYSLLPCILVVCSSIEKSSPNNHASFQMCRNHRKNSSTLKFGH